MSRLPNSKRNALIDDFHNGIEDPNYEVIMQHDKNYRARVRFPHDTNFYNLLFLV